MFKHKTYKGIKTGYVAGTTAVKLYNGTTSINVNVFLTDLFCTVLQTFLKNECKVDCSYDSAAMQFTIDKIPYTFYCVALGNVFSSVGFYTPFGHLAVNPNAGASTSRPCSFKYSQSTGEYEITLRFLGDPGTQFWLYIYSYAQNNGTALSAPLIAYYPLLVFIKGDDLLSGRRFGGVSVNLSTTCYIFEVKEDGDVVPVRGGTGADTALAAPVMIATTSADKTEFPDRLFLKQKEAVFLRLDGTYYFPSNMGLPNAASYQSDTQSFIAVNGEVFWINSSSNVNYLAGGIVKCPTPG